VRDSSSKLAELVDEFRNVVAGRRPWGDAVAPPIVFALCNLAFGLWPAVGCAVGSALAVTAFRIARRRSPRYALGGLAAACFASLLAVGLSRAEGYFLPGMMTGTVTAALARPQRRGVSVGRPCPLGRPEARFLAAVRAVLGAQH